MNSVLRMESENGEHKLVSVTLDEEQSDMFFIVSQLPEAQSRRFEQYEVSYAQLMVGRVRDDDEYEGEAEFYSEPDNQKTFNSPKTY